MQEKLNYYLTKSANAVLKDTVFVDFLLSETKFLDKLNPSLKFRMICLDNGLTEIPKCICGKPLTIEKSYGKSFTKFCSPKCRAENNKIHIDKNTLIKLKHLSLEEIARELNIKSPQIIKNWFKEYNIKRPVDFLENREWLYNEYITLKKTVYEISDELPTSPARVSVYLNKHNIQTRTIADYDISPDFTSNGENEVKIWIQSLGIKVIQSYRKLGKELDLYMPDYNFAIEYNGLYWHSEEFKGRHSHKEKFDLCNENDINLLQIWEDDWNFDWKQDKLKSMILNKLKINRRIFARKCDIRIVSLDDKNKFLEENHLQGKDRSLYKYGLYHDDKLLSVMTFGKPRFTKDADYELIRFATLKGYNVVGGASKLLTYFQRCFIEPITIISYSDNDYSDGGLYKTLGFKKDATSEKYYWFKNGKKYPRYTFRNSETLTENENAHNLGFRKIWTSGITKWLYRS